MYPNLTAAALEAGYSPRSARKLASKMIRNPRIRKEIKHRMGKQFGEVLNVYGLAEW